MNQIRKQLVAAGCAACMILSASAALNRFCTGCYEVIVEGKSIGYIETKETYDRALTEINQEIAGDFGTEYTLNPQPEMKGAIIMREDLSSEQEIFEQLAQMSDCMQPGYVLVVDSQELATVVSAEDAEKVQKIICEQFQTANGKAYIRERVEVIGRQVSTASYQTVEEAVATLMNSGRIHVVNHDAQVYFETIEYQTQTQEDSSMYQGSQVVLQEGIVGEKMISAVEESVNGVIVGTTLLSEVVTQEPVDEIVKVGTKAVPNQGSGSFIMPTAGRLTSGYGGRWGRMHNGLDLAAPSGTPIYASDAGVVICAEYKGSYGNLVKIDHKNGYVTYYAHCSELLVNVGDAVAQGQLIAKVGNTGNSTGAHCHFEIQLNGEPQNPMNYIK